MKNEIKLPEYICDVYSSREIHNDIIKNLLKNEVVIIDCSNTKVMTSICSGNIFGDLYVSMGSKQFFTMIEIKGADDDLKRTILSGIQDRI